MPKLYAVPLNEIRRELVIVNSPFIATLTPVFSVKEARTFLVRIKLLRQFAFSLYRAQMLTVYIYFLQICTLEQIFGL